MAATLEASAANAHSPTKPGKILDTPRLQITKRSPGPLKPICSGYTHWVCVTFKRRLSRTHSVIAAAPLGAFAAKARGLETPERSWTLRGYKLAATILDLLNRWALVSQLV